MLRIAFSCAVLLSAARASDSKTAGVCQFWNDDYKLFDQRYGKTSDGKLYGATLPATYTFGLDLKNTIPTDNAERYLTSGKNILELDTQPYDLGDRYAKLFAKSLYTEKAKPAVQFVSFADINPVSKPIDPEIYNYIKLLEQSAKQKNVISRKMKKTYTSIDSDVEADELYISIQDILDAYEANKKNSKGSKHDDEDYNQSSKGRKHKNDADDEDLRYSRSRNRSKSRSPNGSMKKSRCISGKCRTRVYSRPHIRKIEHYRYTER